LCTVALAIFTVWYFLELGRLTARLICQPRPLAFSSCIAWPDPSAFCFKPSIFENILELGNRLLKLFYLLVGFHQLLGVVTVDCLLWRVSALYSLLLVDHPNWVSMLVWNILFLRTEQFLLFGSGALFL
jgi:hypothetical protein